MTPVLRSERLNLSPYAATDEDQFVSLLQDEAVGRWFGDGTQSVEQTHALFRRIFGLVYAENQFPIWAVRHEGRYIGHAEIKPSPERWLDGHEIVCGLFRGSWGMGLGTELGQLLTSYGHETLALSEVHATVDSENIAPITVLKRLGFTQGRTVAEDNGRTTLQMTSVLLS
ncbi:GNAT family N-acetyltransferase [Streptomyces sp. NPDC055239]